MGWRDDPIVQPAGKWRDDPVVQPAAEPAPVGGPHPLNTTGGEPTQPSAEPRRTLGQAAADQVSPRGLHLGAQAVAKMPADVLGAPGDVAGLTGQAAQSGARDLSNLAFGDEGGETFRGAVAETPPARILEDVGSLISGALPTSEDLQFGFGNLLRSLGLGDAIVPEAEMSPTERASELGVRIGGEGMLGSAGMIRAAGSPAAGNMVPKAVSEAAQRGDAGRTFAGDTATGVGAGTAMGSLQETNLDDILGTTIGPGGETVANLLAAAAGGMTGSAGARAAGAAGRGAGAAGRKVTDAFGATTPEPRPTAVDPRTGEPFKQSVMENAGFVLRNQASDAETAGPRILDRLGEIMQDEGLAETGRPTSGEIPTVGALSSDRGLQSLEKASRTIDERPFLERDAGVSDLRSRTVESVAPEGDGRTFTDEFQGRAAARRGEAQERVSAAEGAEEAFASERRQQGDTLAAEGAAGSQAARTLDEILTGELTERQSVKNRAADAIDPEGTVERDAGFLQEAADEVTASRGALNDPSATVPGGLVGRIRALAETDPETGEIVGPGTVTVKDLNALRPEISDAIAAARKEQNFTMADNLRKLQGAINDDIARLAEEGGEAGQRALEFQRVFQEEFAPLFARGPGDEAAAFRRDFNLDRTNRTTTPPSETAGRFLRPASPEKAESLRRVIDASPRGAEGRAAARQFLLADMVQAGVVDQKSGAVNRVKLGKWRQRWGDETLEGAAPGLADEVDALTARAGADEATAAKLRQEAKAAAEQAKLTEQEISKGALGFALGKDPVKAIDGVFNSGDSERAMRSIVEEIGDDEAARTGLKQATREWLMDKGTSTEGGVGKRRPVSLANLSKLFEQKAGTLGEVFSPDEMNKLRQVHRMLVDDQAVKSARAVAGSDSTPRAEQVKQLKGSLEGAMKLHFGVLKGGAVMRVLNVFESAFTSDRFADKVQRAITQMMLDPELAALMLSKQQPGPAWNARLQQLLLGGEALRNTSEDEPAE